MTILSRRKPSIDIGLAVLSVVNKNQALTLTEIADVCEVPYQTIQKIYESAMKKIRNRKVFSRQDLNYLR